MAANAHVSCTCTPMHVCMRLHTRMRMHTAQSSQTAHQRISATAFFHPYPEMKGCNSGATAHSCIVDCFLWLGGSHSARDEPWLREAKIARIVNCAGNDSKYDTQR